MSHRQFHLALIITSLTFVTIAGFGCKESDKDARLRCMNRMKILGLCLREYAKDHSDQFPESLDAFLKNVDPIFKIGETNLCCPSAIRARKPSPRYSYKPPTTIDDEEIVAWDSLENHPGRRIVLFYSMSVQTISEERFKQIQEHYGR